MRIFSVIILVSVVLSLALNDLIVYADFSINRNFISSFLCIDRDNPDSVCKGKCFLNKKITESKDQEKKLPNQNTEKKTTVVYVQADKHVTTIKDSNNLSNRLMIHDEDIPKFHYLKDIFHPPQRA